MANYWDTFKPGLLAGEDYWEDFTPEAPTETGVVGKVTGKRYQPWEKGYHNIAGLVDDSGQYDAWYDPDPPPETSMPDWGTPEGYDNWKTRIGLETGNGNGNGNTGDGTYIGPDGVEGAGRIENSIVDAAKKAGGSDIDFNLQDWLGSVDLSKVALSLATGNPLAMVLALSNTKIDSILDSVLNLTKSDTEIEQGTSGVNQDPQTGAGTGSMAGEYT